MDIKEIQLRRLLVPNLKIEYKYKNRLMMPWITAVTKDHIDYILNVIPDHKVYRIKED
jgi:hypothetical protein